MHDKVKIPIKKYEMDEQLSWEERYRQLEKHHTEETQWLIQELGRFQTLRGRMREQIAHMLSRPQMHASTTEGIELLFLLLIEEVRFLEKGIPPNETFENYKRFIHKKVPKIGATTLSGYYGDGAFDKVVEVLRDFLQALES